MLICMVLLMVHQTVGECDLGSEAGWKSPPRVQQLNASTVLVSWEGLFNESQCVDSFEVRSCKVSSVIASVLDYDVDRMGKLFVRECDDFVSPLLKNSEFSYAITDHSLKESHYYQVKAAIGHGADNDDYYGPVEIHTSFAAVFPTKSGCMEWIGWNGPLSVRQLNLSAVVVSWAGLFNQSQCVDRFVVKVCEAEAQTYANINSTECTNNGPVYYSPYLEGSTFSFIIEDVRLDVLLLVWVQAVLENPDNGRWDEYNTRQVPFTPSKEFQPEENQSSDGIGNEWGTPENGELGISKVFEFETFGECWGFMSRVALQAEKVGLYPKWSNHYNMVTIILPNNGEEWRAFITFIESLQV